MRLVGAHLPNHEIAMLDAIARERRVARAVVLRWAIIEYINQHCPQPDMTPEKALHPAGQSQQPT